MKDFGPWARKVVLAALVLSACPAFAQGADSRPAKSATEWGRRSDAVYPLYALMAGIWNAPPGASRVAEACDASGEILERVRKLATRPIPEFAAMIRSSIALREACEDNVDATVDREIDRISVLFYQARIALMIQQ